VDTKSHYYLDEDDKDPDFSAYKDRLRFILRRVFQASTKINTITIHYDPDPYKEVRLQRSLADSYAKTEVLARALSTTLERE
jgi:hypothetical protein